MLQLATCKPDVAIRYIFSFITLDLLLNATYNERELVEAIRHNGGDSMERNWLRRIRLNQRMSQKELSDKAKINRSFYTQIENGKRNPSPYTAQRIARVLGIPWTFFFTIECGVSQQNAEGEYHERNQQNHHLA